MSILVRLKNKLQDPSSYETKIREFDEFMSHLKTENVELHNRIDQLEALYKTSMRTQQIHSLEEHVRQLEQENERLFVENQCQRQEYERFLDQLTTMVIRTAVMQESIRKECATIYHIIERLSVLTVKNFQTKDPIELIMKERKSLSWENLNKSCECFSNHRNIKKLATSLIQSTASVSSSSSSSSTTNCSISTLDSWANEQSLDSKNGKSQILVLNQRKEEEEEQQQQQEQILQRSETFVVSKQLKEESSSSLPKTSNDRHIQHHSNTRTIVPTKSPTNRPSKLPSRSLNSKIQSSNNNNNNRSSATTVVLAAAGQKTSKLPIRTTSVVTQKPNAMKKSNIPMSTIAQTKNNTKSISNRSNPSTNNNNNNNKNPIIKKPIRPSSTAQPRSYKNSPCPTTISDRNTTKTTCTINKSIRTNLEPMKSNVPIQQMNSTSSDSSIEEQENINKLLSILQDEGYSTWSSIDIKDDGIANTIKKIETNDKEENDGLVKNWLDTSKQICLNSPVNEVDNNKQNEDISSYLHSSVDDSCSTDDTSIGITSTTISSSTKDISLDSLDSPQSKEQVTLLSTIFSRSDTYDKVIHTSKLSNIIDDLSDSTSSSASSSTFHMSDYIEDNFIDENDSTTSEDSASYETTIIKRITSLKPQKRLLFPGLLNRLIFFRRTLSESDLQQKKFYINENENQYYVYHSNIINEHSVEINLMNTYGSDSELHVWSSNCAEQRKFLSERQQQQQQLTNEIEDNSMIHENYNQQLALERQILLQQIYEYPWLLQENDLDRTTLFSTTTNNEQTLASPTSDIIVPTHNPDFYQLCTLTNSSSFAISYDPNGKQTTCSTTASIV